MTTALVTGATGQDGSYLVERLLDEGVSVHGVVRPGPAEALPPAVVTHVVDLRDRDGLAEVVASVAPDEVYNLGGLSSVAASWSDPVLAAEVSGLAVAALLEAAWQLQSSSGRPVRVLQASSAEVYGGAPPPQSERTPLAPGSPYGAAKAFAQHLVGVYRGRGLHAVSTVLFNHESPRRPDTFVTRKITSTVARISRGLADELVLGNLDARRDWGWAPDYVDAMVRALRHPSAEDYVVATGESHSVRDFVAAAFARAGVADWAGLVRSDPAFARPVDTPEQVGDASRARQVLGWAPTVPFAEIVGRMVDADLADLADPTGSSAR